MSVVLWGGLVAWLGPGMLPYLVLQAVLGFSLLEVVNYMEHYGMLRQMVGAASDATSGSTRRHSWNSNNIATNVLLYHLQRHSDHHANPTRRYQALRDFGESPGAADRLRRDDHPRALPAVWRRVMDKRVSPTTTATSAWPTSPAQAGEAAREVRRCRAAGSSRRRSRSDRPHQRRRRRGAGGPLPRLRLHLRGRGRRRARGFAAGTAWAEIPDDWCCPDCGVREKVDFVPVERVEAVA